MQQTEDFEKQISACIIQLRMRAPFFASLALFARIRSTDKIPTAATNGRDIFINPAFWAGLTAPQRLGLLIHEVLHVALLHVPRRGSREPLRWNIAADIVVNGMIAALQDVSLPAGKIQNSQLAHLSVEEIYHLLQVRKLKLPTLPVADLLVGRRLNEAGYARLEQHWQQAIQQACIMSSLLGQGTLPAGMERELDNIRPAQLDWRSYLWRFLVQTPTDFQGYDRRFIGQRLYLETLQGESVHVYIAIDTSGSIDQQLMTQFASEVLGILSAYPHIVASLYYVDAECHGPYVLEKGALPKPVGGGGTDFRPFFAAVAARHTEYQTGICVYLTDGYGTFPEEAFTLPVLWVLSPGGLPVRDVPFGETVRLIPDL